MYLTAFKHGMTKGDTECCVTVTVIRPTYLPCHDRYCTIQRIHGSGMPIVNSRIQYNMTISRIAFLLMIVCMHVFDRYVYMSIL